MRVKLDMENVYESLENKNLIAMPSHVVWTKTAKRLSVLVSECLKNNEPILLVGETGCGKTTIVQLIANFLQKQLIAMNAHQNTETGDILGAQRPVRNRSTIQELLLTELRQLFSDEVSELETLMVKYESIKQSDYSLEVVNKINNLIKQSKTLFEWTDGPLIQALKEGNFFLLDEISLADDSVLERLNSVLEPERSLLLAEKGSGDIHITANDGFQFFATMNPGGDYGKKELSPALRNRFTEIWVPSMEDFQDVSMIVEAKIVKKDDLLVKAIIEFSEWFALRYGNGNASSGVISLRDILAWVEFINATIDSLQNDVKTLVQGAAMVFIDALGTNNTAYLAANLERLKKEKMTCFEKIFELMNCKYDESILKDSDIIKTDEFLQCGAFKIDVDFTKSKQDSFHISAPTTSLNLMRVIRAIQVNKPILLEGSPGVGKTSLIQALADATGNSLTRINLSEQTDLIDLFGSDTPGETTGEFVWRDAPFLRAMQKGEWVLLDEMNLASQSVLEGLNACLDHRGEAYIPELDKSFTKQKGFMVFAAQNPQYQGGGRKGLPKSFVNRFSVVYADSLTSSDLNMIARHLYPNIAHETIDKMIQLMSLLDDEVCNKKSFGSLGSPWEFNLRDTLRWLSLLDKGSEVGPLNADDFLNVVVKQRFRSVQDKQKVDSLIESIFGKVSQKDNFFAINEDVIEANGELVNRFDINQFRFDNNKSKPLQCKYDVYESFLRCIKYNWPLILTGPSNSGKTELIKLMSGLIGNKVLEFSMNSDVDSMDILGGYEQVDLTRKLSYVLIKLKTLLRECLSLNIHNNSAISKLFDFINNTIIDDVIKFEQFVTLFNESLSLYSSEQLDTVNKLKEDIMKFSELLKKQNNSSVKFEWFDGMLVQAVEEGHWLILDNANLCSPSVLDRLNSLLETNGSLMINECSLEDGRPRLVKPHPNFRLFLTCNPKYGELSRAMRNRDTNIENKAEEIKEEEEEDVDMDQDVNDDEDIEDGDASEDNKAEGEENNDDENGENQTDSELEEDQELNNNQAESNAGGEEANEDEENKENQLEGLDNAHSNDATENSEDKETRQAEGNEGEGADNEAASEKQDVGASGTTQEQQAQQDSEDTDINREKAKESMKQLGDVLKEYHNRKKEINEASADQQEDENNNNVDGKDAEEFEHLDGDTGGDNLQALGDADKEEEIRPFDEDLEISEREEEENLDEAMNVEKDENDGGEFEGNNGENQNNAAVTEETTENQIKSLEDNQNIVDSYLQDNIENLDDLDQLVATIPNTPLNDYSPRDLDESRELWQKAELKTNELASNLSEQLRLILEPTLATKLRGDYKTGKRLNMKRIIPYIASQFRKDKIWLRRTKPSKRTYQIMVAIDNSKSMAENPLNVQLTFEAIALVTKALTQLESGGLSIMKFGEASKEVIDFNTQFSNNKGEEIISEFNFKEEKTNVLNMVCESMKIFEKGKQEQTSQEELWQLQIVLSDGVCEDHDTLVRLVRRCREKKIMLVFVIIDCNNSKESIMDMSQVSYVNNKLTIKKYLDTFPFEYYVVVKDIKELPGMLSLILRQYFAQS
ncbi:P-loop containing nucleoside triphosphate hydrolase protein [Hanseniaspora valbyensis NRRL Y-1626]|uniref:p-loop containing nucleoside triphosphate hydrolase protein n=1 Tax=Hanseniaspora valbyensis NRRL Y-1626 TaxID=766949 RepID=A0A1B7TIA8_9ASCO|nr:P-loop containing nucleoside triphosphate hydrolase protein [Hanseniaspora valbyensis NRRL Y-1626]